MPRPRPYVEIFVYSSSVEGVHLRGGEIARGGLRWSDRHDDFRTKILSLAKAQQVKNVIVPVGAKVALLSNSRHWKAGVKRSKRKAFVVINCSCNPCWT